MFRTCLIAEGFLIAQVTGKDIAEPINALHQYGPMGVFLLLVVAFGLWEWKREERREQSAQAAEEKREARRIEDARQNREFLREMKDEFSSQLEKDRVTIESIQQASQEQVARITDKQTRALERFSNTLDTVVRKIGEVESRVERFLAENSRPSPQQRAILDDRRKPTE